MIRPLIAALCAATLLSACTETADPTPPSPTTIAESTPTTRAVDPAKVTAEAAFGDLTSVDVCEFLRPEDLIELGQTRIGVPAAFDACVIEVAAPDNARASIRAGDFFDVRAEPSRAPSRTLAGGVRIYDGAGGSCRTDILFPDNVGLSVQASMSGPPTTDLCPLVRKAVDAMGTRFAAGIVSTRKVSSDSLARLDACAVLPADLPGFDPTRQTLRARHWCASPTGDATTPYVSLTMALGYPPAADPTATTKPIDGRPTVLQRSPAGKTGSLHQCTVSTAHHPIAVKDLPGATEYAILEVWLPTDDRCATAEAIAAQVWPKLPR
ncbi:hypothetical protein [Actinokineospora sp. HUAS TT18]|uniref:hypothetical protein n=1 Tax=Actinokineospora sp. HUAS TT18 TaxID=3447451 RepID=UPI003F527D45